MLHLYVHNCDIVQFETIFIYCEDTCIALYNIYDDHEV